MAMENSQSSLPPSSLWGRTCSHHWPLRTPGCQALLLDPWYHLSTSKPEQCSELARCPDVTLLAPTMSIPGYREQEWPYHQAWGGVLGCLGCISGSSFNLWKSLTPYYWDMTSPTTQCLGLGLLIIKSKWASVHGVQTQGSIMRELISRMNLNISIPTTRSSLSWW